MSTTNPDADPYMYEGKPATKHTAGPSSKPSPTPWKCDQWWNIHAANAVQVADVCVAKGPLHPSEASANAARIVQCVNTCAKFPDPTAALTDLRLLIGQARGLLAEGDTDKADKMLVAMLGVLDGEEG